VRINAQFIRVRDDLALWSGTYDRELVDVLGIQDELSRGIVNSLRLKLGRGRRRYEISAAAYDCYLRARALIIQRGLPGWDDSVPLFERSIENDVAFAPAYAGLAIAHVYRSAHAKWDVQEETTKMREAAQKAIQLDPLLAEAHDALGMVYARDAQWEQSEKSFRRALELDPNRSMSAQHFTMELLLPLGRIEEGLKQLRAAEKLDPLSAEVQFFLYYVLTAAGRFEEAARHCSKVPEHFWERPSCQADGELRRGNVRHAIEILEPKIGQWGNGDGFLGCAYVRAGLRAKAEQLADFKSTQALDQARIFACLGDKDRTFRALDRAAGTGPFRVGRALTWPELSPAAGRSAAEHPPQESWPPGIRAGLRQLGSSAYPNQLPTVALRWPTLLQDLENWHRFSLLRGFAASFFALFCLAVESLRDGCWPSHLAQSQDLNVELPACIRNLEEVAHFDVTGRLHTLPVRFNPT
jgi:tetratricopeptide (TPR) repeat protein